MLRCWTLLHVRRLCGTAGVPHGGGRQHRTDQGLAHWSGRARRGPSCEVSTPTSPSGSPAQHPRQGPRPARLGRTAGAAAHLVMFIDEPSLIALTERTFPIGPLEGRPAVGHPRRYRARATAGLHCCGRRLSCCCNRVRRFFRYPSTVVGPSLPAAPWPTTSSAAAGSRGARCRLIGRSGPRSTGSGDNCRCCGATWSGPVAIRPGYGLRRSSRRPAGRGTDFPG